MRAYRKVKLIYTGKAIDPGPSLKSPEEVVSRINKGLEKETIEVFLALFLDGRHRVIEQCEISRGTLTASLVHPRELYRPALIEGAAAVIVAHNHPSGDSSPSIEDIELTKRLIKAGNLIGITFLDHIVIGVGSHYSFKNNKPDLFYGE